MKKTDIYIVMGLLLSCSLAWAGQGAIRLYPQVALEGSTATLGQIAAIDVVDPALRRQLNDLAILEIPSGRQHDYIALDRIEQSLRLAGLSPMGLDIYGASRCEITLPNALVPEGDDSILPEAEPGIEDIVPGPGEQASGDIEVFTLADELTRQVARQTRIDQQRLYVQWECGEDPTSLMRPYEADHYEISPRAAMGLGKVYFEVIETNKRQGPETHAADADAPEKQSSESSRRLSIRGEVLYLCQSIVAGRTLYPGEVITGEAVRFQARRVDNLRDVGLNDMQQILGQEAARTITEGTLITPRLIKKLILVERNDIVDIQLRNGLISLRLKGKARDSGGLGDIIVVEDLYNKSLIPARISGARRVIVGSTQTPTPVAAEVADYALPSGASS